MSSLIDLVNLSLSMIGESPINNFDDGTTKSDICRTNTPLVLQAMLSEHRWNFNRERVLLAADATAPAFGFAYQYTLPGDCLRVWGIGDDGEGGPITSLKWKREGGKILTNEAGPLPVHYNAYNELPSTWSGTFMMGVANMLAGVFAGAIASDAKLALSKQQEALTIWLPNARGNNGQEGSQEIIQSDDLLVVRDG